MERLAGRASPAVITKLCVRDAAKKRTFALDEDKTKVVTSIEDIYQDDDIDLVVEVMGGTGVAKTLVIESMKRGKSIVTANKALLAESLEELQALSLEKNVTIAYEAAVCGGIPIIHTLQSCFTGDVIHEVMGICNGTTNYMLGLMEDGADYDAVLKEAQDIGYAEADPTADVEGHDVRAKICLLAKLAFGKTLVVDDVPCRGITDISTVDFEYANCLGCTIKLIGTAVRLSKYGEHDGPLSVYVTPKMVPTTHALAMAKTNGNGVVIRSANLGTTSYMGPGAGRFETANSVVADIVRVANQQTFPVFPKQDGGNDGVEGGLELEFNYISPFYIRIPFVDSLGIIRSIGELAENCEISIHSVLQNPIKDRLQADVCVTTEPCSLQQMQQFCHQMAQQDYCRQTPVFMPLLMKL
uniref:Homoserine dehydrogenase n=1 Tax=Cyclophora tenuis TaxID=216820 RepID=A0A7S1D758_CYCTE